MKKRNLFVSCAAMSLLLSAVVACNNSGNNSQANNNSSTPATSSSNNNASSGNSANSSKSSSSSTPAVPTPDATQTAVATQQTETAADGSGETITWDAQDTNKEADGFTNAGKFSSTGSYVKFTFTATMAMRARLFVTMPPRDTNVYDRSKEGEGVEKGHQSIWYNWYDGDDWKYNVQVNTVDVDQDKMGTYKVGNEDIPMKELVYSDFLAEGASTLEAPWFEFDVLQGRNTIRIERNLGYSVEMKSFKVVGAKATAPATGDNTSAPAAGSSQAA